MRYVPRRSDSSVNVSKEHPLVEATTLFVGLGILFAIAAAFLVLLIDIVLYFVPVEREVAMFDAWLPEDITAVADDDARLLATEQLLQRLARHSPESPYTFRVEIDDSAMVNAMAFPGGLIVVTSGLLDAVESENELAFVLGHEMGHYHNRDHIRGMGRALVLSLFLAALSGSNDTAGFGLSIADLALLGFSRQQEQDADSFGLELVQAEYGHINGATALFERLARPDTALSELLAYTSTHPASERRIEAMISLANSRGWPLEGEVAPKPGE